MEIIKRLNGIDREVVCVPNGMSLSNAVKLCKNLRWADLRGAKLSRADLRDADLRDADLRDADLRGAKLSMADLRDADLRGADLRDADLRDADLPINTFAIYGYAYFIFIHKNQLRAGCQVHDFEKWRNFGIKDIENMNGEKAVEFYPTLIKLLDFYGSNNVNNGD